jgi:hypothetical protein
VSAFPNSHLTSWDWSHSLTGKCPIPPLIGGMHWVKGHNIKRYYIAGKPFDMLRAESSVERLRRACPVLTGCLPGSRQGWGTSHWTIGTIVVLQNHLHNFTRHIK